MMPRITLALDNCFASKRWTEPGEWMDIAKDMGIYAVEASADNECDPLYSPPDALHDWVAAVQMATRRTGVRVANLYSGHGSYATLGLAHPDARVRDHIQHNWLDVMIGTAAELDAGLGFFCHAFSQSVLGDAQRYAAAETDLIARLGQLAQVAEGVGLNGISVEQMYSPHQIPWTLPGADHLLREIYRLGGAPMYLTLDAGHAIGQRGYLKPTRAQVAAYVAAARAGDAPADVWIGLPDESFDPNAPDAVDCLLAQIERQGYLFAEPDDGDPYHWLRRFGAYSPIIHLQQTDGMSSAHRPFTAQFNATGIIQPEKLLRALAEAYARDDDPGLPPRCQDIYLTLEIFSGTAQKPAAILANIRESVAYWRQYIPEDGLPLDRLIS
ncbi:MAG: hypothetical protein IT320_12340 [Anaerolineae bacterium]|nr:hypothetical protein [Anaerolineae bacterium]